jgi:lipoprotein-anchoring transpeptidase ErfK/SrfK
MSRTLGIAGTVVLLALAALASDSLEHADAAAPEARAGVLLQARVAARAKPHRAAKVVLLLRQFRPDFRPTTLLVLGERRGARGERWLRVSLPLRPNGRTGWVPARSLSTWAVHRRLVIDLSARTLRLLERGRTRFRTRVAVGKPGAETPAGRFYVTAAFRPKERFYGVWALETSAWSRLSDWPGGGIVGIHGTSMPWLLGRAVSHGCVRVSNDAARMLRRLVRPGTPVHVVP